MRAVIGLGSNVGDRLAILRSAAAAIASISDVRARSFVYETAPVGGVDQPDFLNAALAIDYGGTPLALLDALHAIETQHGRDRANEQRWGPRALDLDLLWIDGETVLEARLVVPHPRLHERAFALLPLWDVAPEACKDISAAAPGHVVRLDVRL